jgi:hypothetical protein
MDVGMVSFDDGAVDDQVLVGQHHPERPWVEVAKDGTDPQGDRLYIWAMLRPPPPVIPA